MVRYGFDLIAELERFHDCMHDWRNICGKNIMTLKSTYLLYRTCGDAFPCSRCALQIWNGKKAVNKKIATRRDFSNGISQKAPFINFRLKRNNLYPLVALDGFLRSVPPPSLGMCQVLPHEYH